MEEVSIKVDRDSISAGDDLDPHEITVGISVVSTVREVVTQILQGRYLPKVAGGAVSWLIDVDGTPVGAVASSDSEPVFVVDAGNQFQGSRIYFRYQPSSGVEESLRKLR